MGETGSQGLIFSGLGRQLPQEGVSDVTWGVVNLRGGTSRSKEDA